MNVDVQKKVKIIQKSMDSIRKMDKTVHTISFSRLADEIEMPLSELTDIFLDIEDMFLNEQKRVIRKMMELIEKGLKNGTRYYYGIYEKDKFELIGTIIIQDINKKNNESILIKLAQTKKVRTKIIKLKQDIDKPDFGRG